MSLQMGKITAKHFSESEFKRCTPPCSLQDMKQDFMNRLDTVRDVTGIPLVITCAYRSREYDLAKGRSGNSAHTRGMAVDIRCTTSVNAFKIVQAALKVGFTRIGIGKTFIHLDSDTSLPQNVMWNYYE